ncbi:MAG: hypothetical protein DRJ40_07800 [Thermoprotei archaeon]|nr:MAG: hypothetical protein DRJ40_07800 [Thermoprotei archaeon]
MNLVRSLGYVMSTDLFFDLFVKEVEEKLTNGNSGTEFTMKPKIPTILFNEIKKLWVSELPKRTTNCSIVAVDGGIRSLGLEGGREVVITRAIAVTSSGARARQLRVELSKLQGFALKLSLLTQVECSVALEALEKVPNVDYLLLDGSLYYRVVHALHRILRPREIADTYYLPELIMTVTYVATLLKRCRELNVVPLFITKDSSSRMLKDYVISNIIYEQLYENKLLTDLEDITTELLLKARNLYSVTWVKHYRANLEKLQQHLRAAPTNVAEELIHCIELWLQPHITDVDLIRSTVTTIGFSRPLNIGLIDIHLDNLLQVLERSKKRVLDRISDALKMRINEVLGNESYWYTLLMNALKTIPTLYMTYIRVTPDDTPLAIEIPNFRSSMGFVEFRSRRLSSELEILDPLSIVVSGYRNSTVYNVWLYLAHQYATFRSTQFRSYVKYLEAHLSKYGLILRKKRREKMVVAPLE